MRIREFSAGDEKALTELHNSIFSYWIDLLGHQYHYRYLTEEDIRSWLADEETIESRIFIAEEDGFVGYAHCILKYEVCNGSIPTLYFRSTDWNFGQARLGVHPLSRQKGIGTKLVDHSLEYQWSIRPKVAVGHTYSDNFAAAGMLRMAGFSKHEVFYYHPFSDTQSFACSSVFAMKNLQQFMPKLQEIASLMIRDANQDDTESVRKILQENIWWNPLSHTKEWVVSYLNGEYGHQVLVAELNRQVVCAMDINVRSGEIGIAGTLSKYKRKGIGSRLFLALLERAKALGFERVLIDSGMTQREAINMYHKFGFSIERTQDAWIIELQD